MSNDLRRPVRTFTIRQLCLEFGCTARALRFYEDKGLLAPARQGLARIYSHHDRARLQLILRGKRVGIALAEIGELLDLYELGDGGAAQMVSSLSKFRERITDLELQREAIESSLEELRRGVVHLEARLADTRPDLLPRAADYDQVLRERLGDLEPAK